MKPNDFHDFLDHPDQVPHDPTERELAALLKELSQEPIPDPGSDYWNQFNHRLQMRLQEPKTTRWAPWFKPGLALVAFALVLAVFIPITLTTSKPRPDLASLSSDSLMMIGELYSSDLWNPLGSELADSELNHLLETTDTLFEDAFPTYQFYENDGWEDDIKQEG